MMVVIIVCLNVIKNVLIARRAFALNAIWDGMNMLINVYLTVEMEFM